MKTILTLLISIYLFACESKEEDAAHTVNNINYVKDYKTGICFGYVRISGKISSSLATVPCEKVEKWLVNGPSLKPEIEPELSSYKFE